MYANTILVGRVTRDVEVQTMQGGKNGTWEKADFTLACKVQGGKKDEFFDCEATGPVAKVMGEWVKKGNPILVEAEPQINRWEKDINGETVKFQRTVFRVNKFSFMGGKNESNQTQNQGQNFGNNFRQAPAQPSNQFNQPAPQANQQFQGFPNQAGGQFNQSGYGQAAQPNFDRNPQQDQFTGFNVTDEDLPF